MVYDLFLTAKGIFPMNIHIVMHESFESPGAIAQWVVQRGHSVHYTNCYAHEALPKDTSQIDFLIVMGGPQSPSTTLTECPYFNANAEIALIQDAIARKKLVLGVCLGAQLLGEAYGARCEHSPHKEIGVFPITLTAQAKTDPIFSTFPHSFDVGHWHGDMPGVPVGAKILATSAGCPRQIIAYEPGVYGFQCHMEFTHDAIEQMVVHSQQELAELAGRPYVQDAATLRAQQYDSMNQLLFQFLDALVKQSPV